MTKHYLIYRDGNHFMFEIVDENGKSHVCQSVKRYNQIINDFINNGYNIAIENDEKIVLVSKTKKGKDKRTISIQKDSILWNCEYLQTIKESIAKTKEAIIKAQKKKEAKEKRHNAFWQALQSRAAVIGITITLISAIAITGFVFSKSSQNSNRNKDSEIGEEFAILLGPDNDNGKTESLTCLSDKMPLNPFGMQTYHYERSLLFNSALSVDDDLTESAEQSKVEEVEPEAEPVDQNALEYETHLKTYAKYFHLDANKVIEFAKTISNNYTIPFEEINGTNAYVVDNKEAACLVFVHSLNRDSLATSLQDYGYTHDYFVADSSITTLSPDKILSEGETFEQFFGKVCDLLGMDKYWTLGITYLESGRVGSEIAMTKNNFGGLRGKDGFFTYITPEAGIIAHCRNLKRYENMGLASMYELSGKYVFGNQDLIYEYYAHPEDPELQQYKKTMDSWIDNVTWFHNDFLNRSDEVFAEYNLDDNEMTLN